MALTATRASGAVAKQGFHDRALIGLAVDGDFAV